VSRDDVRDDEELCPRSQVQSRPLRMCHVAFSFSISSVLVQDAPRLTHRGAIGSPPGLGGAGIAEIDHLDRYARRMRDHIGGLWRLCRPAGQFGLRAGGL